MSADTESAPFDFESALDNAETVPGDDAPEIIRPEPPEDSAASEPSGPPDDSRGPRFGRSRGNKRGRGDATEPSGSARPSRANKPKKPVPPKPREGTLVKPLTDMYTSVGLMLAPFDPACSTAFLTNAEQCARSMEKLARENESVRRIINSMLQTSAIGGVLIAHLPILLVIMTHHGPEPVKERIAPMALMMNPAAMEAFNNAQNSPEDKPSE